jgi:PAS domain S-box-containing protein
MGKKPIFLLTCSIFIMIAYGALQSLILCGYYSPSYWNSVMGAVCIVLFACPFFMFVKKYHEDIMYSKRMFQDKMEAISGSFIVMVLSGKGEIIDVNRNFELVFSVSKKDIVGTKHSDFSYDKDYERKNLWPRLYAGMSVKKNLEKKLPDGSSIWLSCNYVPVRSNSLITDIIVIANDITKEYENQIDLMNKNKYLEHSAKILRHDMHSGINTYIPRGISSLERRLPDEVIKKYKLESPLKLLKDGLGHTQRVYEGVKAFTNIVKENSMLETSAFSLEEILKEYFSYTAYTDQVIIGKLPTISVNKALFCTAIDNLVRNGLKYNDSESKMVAITTIDNHHIGVIDNGRGMSAEEFKRLSKPYYRKENQVEAGTGLGLNITVAILSEHGFEISVKKQEIGTLVKIKVIP